MWNNKEEVLDRIIRLTEKFKSDYFRSRILASAACRLKQIGDKRAEEILERAVGIGESLQDKRSDFFILLASELSHTHTDFQERSLEFLERGIEYAESIEDDARRSEALSLASEVLAEMGKFDEAIKLLEKVEVYPDSEWLPTYSSLSEALYRVTLAGRLDDAIRIAEKFDEHYRSELLLDIVFALLEMEDYETARTVAERIDEVLYWIEAMTAISCWLVENGKISEGLKLADEIGDGWNSSPPRAYVALKRLEEGDLEGVIELAKRISNEDCLWVIVKVVEELAKRGEFERAIEVAHYIPGYWDFPEAISKIVRELVVRGKVDDAIRLVEDLYPEDDEFSSPRAKLYILATIPETLLKLGRQEEVELHSDRILERLKEFALKKFDWEYIPVILSKMGRLDELSSFVEEARKSDRAAMQLYYLVVGLTEIGEIDRAMELAWEIEGGKARDGALSRIFYELLYEDVERAVEIAEKISYFPWDRFLRAAVERLAEIDVEKAIETAEKIENDDELYRALRAILGDKPMNVCCGLVCLR